MAIKKIHRSLTKSSGGKLSKEQAQLEKAKREVLERGSKHRKPLTLARHRVVKLTARISAAVIVAALILVGLLIYVGKNDGALVYGVSRVVPYPIARVNGDFVSYADYLFEVRSLKNVKANPTGPASAVQQPVDFSSEEGKAMLKDIQISSLDRAKSKVLVRQLAIEHKVSVSQDELNSAINDLIDSQGGRDKFSEAIGKFYGWSFDDFRDEFELDLLKQKLQLVLLPDANKSQLKTAENLVKRARKGEDFAKLVAKFSKDTASKADGGNLGYVGKDTAFVPEFKDAALRLKKGEISDVVVTSFGFHIIRATGQKGDEIKVSHILLAYGKDLEAVLRGQLATAKITNFIKLSE